MRSASIHFVSSSADYEHRPTCWADAFRHSQSFAVWFGPVGVVIFSR